MKTRRFNYHGYPLTESYFNAMLNRGHTEGSADYYARLVKKVESYMIICGISDINEEVANSFFEWWVDKSNPSADLQKRMTVILRRLEQMISGDVIDYSLPRKIPLSLPGHIQLSIDAFEDFLSRYKGLKPDTIRNQTDAVQRFFAVNSISCLKDISLSHIEYGFTQSGQKEVYKSAMRKYLDFLFEEGIIETDLGEVLPMILPRIPNSYPLPSVYTDEEIRAILGSIDRSTVQGSRDFAILLLASSLADKNIGIYHPGNYVFNDCIQMSNGTATEDDCALTVLATIISHPSEHLFICDAGAKCLGLDQGAHGNASIIGHGRVKGHPEVIVAGLSEEVGKLKVSGETTLKVGDKIEIIPNHSCSTANLTEYYITKCGDTALNTITVDVRSNSQIPLI